MLEPRNLHAAANDVLASAILGTDWEESLQQLADATGAGGVSLVRIQGGRHAAHLSSSDWSAFETAVMQGDAPPSQLRYYPDSAYGGGFRVDHDVWTDEEMRRDPYFQEFLRPRGVFFHAKVRLWSEPNDRVTLTLKRQIGLGPYEPSDVSILDSIVPQLRAAFQVSRRVLDAETSGMVRALRDRGGPVFEIDARGRVLRSHATGGMAELGISEQARGLIVVDRQAQAAVDRAIAAAIRGRNEPTLVGMTNRRGERRFLHVIPVPGRARDVFNAAAAVVVIVTPNRVRGDHRPDMFRQALSLTEREAQIAVQLASGSGLQTIAERLDIGLGTVRNHLKSVYSKTGTRRQGELIALLHALQR